MNSSSVNILRVSYSIISLTILISLSALLLISLLHFFFFGQFPLSFIFVKCGFITGKQGGEVTICFVPYMSWTADLPWPITDRLWKKWQDWSPIMMHIYYLHNDLWGKFVVYAITVNIPWQQRFEIWTFLLRLLLI